MSEETNGWKPIAQRGHLALIVLTRAAAARKFAGLAALHDDMALLSILMPDASDSATPLQHLSVDSARSFISEMQPHTLDVLGDFGEDVTALRASLHAALASRPADVAIH